MLQPIEGTILPGPPWSGFSFDRVLQYYDGPRLLLQRTQAGQLYLGWWSDSDDFLDRWIYLPLTEQRLYEVLTGKIASRDALEDPEDGLLFVIDKNLQTDSVESAIVTDSTTLPSDALPRPGARLNLAVPEEISKYPSREAAHIVDVRIESPESDETKRVSAKVVGQFLGNLQRLVDSLGQSNWGNPTARGNIPDLVLGKTRMDPIAAYTGSFGVRLETSEQDDLFGESLARTSLEDLFGLFDVGSEASALKGRLTRLKSRVAKNYRDLLGTIESSLSAASVSWQAPGNPATRTVRIERENARNIIAQIEAVTDETRESLTVRGRFVGGSIRTLRFEIHDLQDGQRFEGTIHDEAREQIENITLGSECEATLLINLQLSETTGEERTTYTLTDIQRLNDVPS